MNTQEKLQQGKALVVVGLGYVGLPLALAFAKKYGPSVLTSTRKN